MNELDSHLEKTSENFEIGSIEKKLQSFKVANKTQNFQNFQAPQAPCRVCWSTQAIRVQMENLAITKCQHFLCNFFHLPNRVPGVLYLIWHMFITFLVRQNQDFGIFCFRTGFWWYFFPEANLK